MMHRNSMAGIFLFIILVLSVLFPYISSLVPKVQPEKGVRRVVLISIDSCNPEYLSPQYMPNLYARIMRDGVKYKLANTVLAAETQSGHTSMLTGAYVSHTGLGGNGMYFPEDWDDPATPGIDYPAGTSIPTFTDPRLILTNTIFEQFANNASMKTAFISGKWRLVPLLSGGADLIFGNAKNGTMTFPPAYYDKVGAPFTYAEGDIIDSWSMKCLIEILKNEPDVDFIFVNLAFLDDVQHAYGAYNEEVYAHLRELDNLFLRLFNELESIGKYDSTLFVITADHGSDRVDYVLNFNEILQNSVNPHINAHVHAEGQSAHIFLENASQLPDAITLFEQVEGVDLIVPWNNTGLPGYGNFSDYNLYPYRNRSGDLYVSVGAHGAVITNPDFPFSLFGMHGGVSTIDVPLSIICKNLQFQPALTKHEIIDIIPRTVDIMPTVASIMNWSLDQMTLDGHILDILA
ncbi:MAG: alkaline phosphatase family protein [Candidatus Helarchaeota archaeon]